MLYLLSNGELEAILIFVKFLISNVNPLDWNLTTVFYRFACLYILAYYLAYGSDVRCTVESTFVDSKGGATDFCAVTSFNGTMTWSRAQGVCLSLNYSSLAIIDTREKENFFYTTDGQHIMYDTCLVNHPPPITICVDFDLRMYLIVSVSCCVYNVSIGCDAGRWVRTGLVCHKPMWTAQTARLCGLLERPSTVANHSGQDSAICIAAPVTYLQWVTFAVDSLAPMHGRLTSASLVTASCVNAMALSVSCSSHN